MGTVGTMVPSPPPGDKSVRNWLDNHPATATYIAFVVTVLLILQVVEIVGKLS